MKGWIAAGAAVGAGALALRKGLHTGAGTVRAVPRRDVPELEHARFRRTARTGGPLLRGRVRPADPAVERCCLRWPHDDAYQGPRAAGSVAVRPRRGDRLPAPWNCPSSDAGS